MAVFVAVFVDADGTARANVSAQATWNALLEFRTVYNLTDCLADDRKAVALTSPALQQVTAPGARQPTATGTDPVTSMATWSPGAQELLDTLTSGAYTVANGKMLDPYSHASGTVVARVVEMYESSNADNRVKLIDLTQSTLPTLLAKLSLHHCHPSKKAIFDIVMLQLPQLAEFNRTNSTTSILDVADRTEIITTKSGMLQTVQASAKAKHNKVTDFDGLSFACKMMGMVFEDFYDTAHAKLQWLEVTREKDELYRRTSSLPVVVKYITVVFTSMKENRNSIVLQASVTVHTPASVWRRSGTGHTPGSGSSL